jgi:hypothetical protein
MGTLKTNFRRSISATAIAIGLSVATGLGVVVVTAVPAAAQTTLRADQIAAIQSSLQLALKAARSEEARAQAIASAIESAISIYGVGATSAITSVVMTTSEAAGVTPTVIGTGLAQASAREATNNNLTAATAIAATIANEGNISERSAYQTTSISLGYTNLASIAAGSPMVTGGVTGGTGGGGGIGTGGIGGGFTGGGAAGGGGGGCLNPSCTHL